MKASDQNKILNLYESNPQRAIAILLSVVSDNHAILRTILATQSAYIASTLPEAEREQYKKDIFELLQQHESDVQADIHLLF